ncbi:hypothetical protein R9C00_16595 [Flammeovirgaceae bacterium SG7u.111]|nr:hypothetical protein [Flammeovirgaceae bacterium SG7u.132]WPO33322.1 hypothetical protein R9C00_16595 [Flammeovirgaceae bacterium SG7u.111]
MSSQNEQKVVKGFQKLLGDIGEAIGDAASLEVSTFTGNFQYKVSEVVKNDTDRARVDQVLKKMTSVKGEVDLKLFAFTSIKIDSDVTNIVRDDISEADKELLTLHKDMIAESREARANIFEMVKNLVNTFGK